MGMSDMVLLFCWLVANKKEASKIVTTANRFMAFVLITKDTNKMEEMIKRMLSICWNLLSNHR
jgi:hypothetical protein